MATAGLWSLAAADDNLRAVTASASDVIVVHYNEIALKLGHRSMFVGRLLENMRRALEGLTLPSLRSAQGRVFVDPGSADSGEIMRRLAMVPGIANMRLARGCEPSIEALEALIDEVLDSWSPRGSFRVNVRRADKSFPMTSPEVAARIGARVAERSGAPVDLKHADQTIYVQIVQGRIYLAFERVEGCGGLPVSTGGRVLLLLSGGIDSPVAGMRMLRRGCRVDALHFHSAPHLGRTSLEKAELLAAVLARGQAATRLSSVAFGTIQSEIVQAAPPRLRVVLYRRMMMRIASRLARRDGCRALVSGDSLGQVASQTLANMSVIEEASSLPLLRPLVGMDKREITDYARSLGTFEISIVADEDCCSLFVPKHPATSASLAEVEAAELGFDVEAMVERAVAERVRESIPADWQHEPAALAAEIA